MTPNDISVVCSHCILIPHSEPKISALHYALAVIAEIAPISGIPIMITYIHNSLIHSVTLFQERK